MSETNSFRIILDLCRFFHDHRRLARIFIKNLKTIQDLQNRVSEIFGFQGFFLLSGGHFLPVSEDIRVLHNDEIVCVIPNNSDANKEQSEVEVTSPKQKCIENRQHKRVLEDIPEESSQNSSPKKKKKKKRHTIVEKYASSSSSEDEEVQKKKKVKKDNAGKSKTDQAASSKEERDKQSKMQGIVEKEVCNIETAHKVLEIKKKLKQKTDEYCQRHSSSSALKPADDPLVFKSVLSKLQSHIRKCNNSGRPTGPDTVRLSRHVDTPIKSFSTYLPPRMITDQYLSKNKVNIVKIDVINENVIEANDSIVLAAKKNESVVSAQNRKHPNSPPENYVKTVVSSFEKNVSPNDKTEIVQNEVNNIDKNDTGQQTEASNYTKTYLDQKDETVSTSEAVLEVKTERSKACSISPMDTTPVFKNMNNSNHESEQSEISFGKNEPMLENQPETPTCRILPMNTTPIYENIIHECSPKNGHSETNCIKEEASNSEISLDISSIPQDSLLPQGTSCDSLNSTNISVDSNSNASLRSKSIQARRLYGSIGSLVEHLRESDSVLSQESDTSFQYVTKRKRIRKRKRKNKKNESESTPITSITPKPIIGQTFVIAQACPKMHIKFGGDGVDMVEKRDEVARNDSLEKPIVKKEDCQKENGEAKTETNGHISPLEEMVVSDENEDPVMENKSILGSDNILRAPLMGDKLEPKVGDIIAFKILKVTEDYTPQVSNYIVGKVETYLLETKTICFKILSGMEELVVPSGKLSLDLTDKESTQDSRYKEFTWNALLEPKLLYP